MAVNNVYNIPIFLENSMNEILVEKYRCINFIFIGTYVKIIVSNL